MVAAECEDGAENCRVVIEPNCSLTWRESLIFFSGISVVSLTVAGFFASMGLWLVLPFAGLELLALGGCLYHTACRLRVRELILISERTVRVERGRSCPWGVSEFPRGWARVTHCRGTHDWYPSRLTIGTAGRNVEVGAFLNESERQLLAAELTRLLVWRNRRDPG